MCVFQFVGGNSWYVPQIPSRRREYVSRSKDDLYCVLSQSRVHSPHLGTSSRNQQVPQSQLVVRLIEEPRERFRHSRFKILKFFQLNSSSHSIAERHQLRLQCGPDSQTKHLHSKFTTTNIGLEPCLAVRLRSEERRVGKECRSRW